MLLWSKHSHSLLCPFCWVSASLPIGLFIREWIWFYKGMNTSFGFLTVDLLYWRTVWFLVCIGLKGFVDSSYLSSQKQNSSKQTNTHTTHIVCGCAPWNMGYFNPVLHPCMQMANGKCVVEFMPRSSHKNHKSVRVRCACCCYSADWHCQCRSKNIHMAEQSNFGQRAWAQLREHVSGPRMVNDKKRKWVSCWFENFLSLFLAHIPSIPQRK